MSEDKVLVSRELLESLDFGKDMKSALASLPKLRALLAQPSDGALTNEEATKAALQRAWQAGYDTAFYGKNPAHQRAQAESGNEGAEPVAWLAQALGENGEVYRNTSSVTEITMRDAKFVWGEGVLNRFNVVISPLYRHPPAPASVVLPERRNPDEDGFDADHYAYGWNACLDRVKELNS